MKQTVNQILRELSLYSPKDIEDIQDKILDQTQEEGNEIIKISGIKLA